MAKRRISKKFERTAYHEAGHAVMAHLLRKRFKYVTIKPDKETLGRVMMLDLTQRQQEEFSIGNFPGSYAQRDIMISLAGPLAEWHFTGKRRDGGAGGDMDSVINVAMAMVGSPEEASAYIEWLWVRTKNHITHPNNWPMVEATAKALLAYEHLSYKRAKRTMEDAWQEMFKLATKK